MKASRWWLPVIWVAVLLATIGAAQLLGAWQVSGRQEVVTGTLSVDDLKGWMTIQQAADGLGVPAEVVIEAIGGPAGVVTSSTAFSAVEQVVPDFSLTTFREILRARLGGQSPAATAAPPTTSPAVPATATVHPSGTPTSTNSVTGQQTLRQVAEDNGLDLVKLIAAAGLPSGVDPDVALRTLRDTVPGFEIGQVRDAVDRLS